MRIHHLLLTATLLLAGCGHAATMPFGTPTYIPDNAKQVHFFDRRDLVEYCVDHAGVFTTDRTACVISGRHICEQVTQFGGRDTPQWSQLNAMCDSTWRPQLVLG